MEEEIPREEELFSRYLISLNKANKLKEMMEEIHRMESHRDPSNVPIRTFKEPDIPEPPFFAPILTDGANDKLPNVSKKLELNISEGLIAKTKINPGDTLLVEKGALLAYHPTEKFSIPAVYRCHYCLKIVEYFVTCPGCDVIIFCGYKCRYYSWNEFHRWECFGMQRGYFISNSSAYVSMRMLFFGLQFEENAISKTYYNDQYNHEHFINLPYELQEKNNMELFSILKDSVDVVLYLTEHTQFFEWIVQYPKYKEKSQFKLYSMIGGMLVRYHFQFQKNHIKLKQESFHGFPTNKIDYYGDGIFLSAQWFATNTHPNTMWFHFENYLVIKACKEILPGDKITVQWNEEIYQCDCKECSDKAKLNTFLCKKCKSPMLPIESANETLYLNIKFLKSADNLLDDVLFKCTNCKKEVLLKEYKNTLQYAQHNIDIYYKRKTPDYLKYATDEYKKILNPTHIFFVAIHTSYIHFYIRISNEPHKAVEKAKEALNLIKLHYGNGSKVHVFSQIYILYQFAKLSKQKIKFAKNIIHYCRSLLEQTKPAAEFYCLLKLLEPVKTVFSLESELLSIKNPISK